MSIMDSPQPETRWRDYIDGAVMLMGMIGWTISKAIPVEFLWSSAADCQRLLYG